ncbi:MAG: AAA family ATPase [Chitinivibrionales bacterium]|nr:AAA family ATPase [Chitinivibrionales bacterium]
MKITTVRTKTGAEVPIGKFTVLVGPNNVGKSQTLRDIHERLVSGPNAKCVILDDVVVEKPANFEDLLSGLQKHADPRHVGMHLVRGISSNLTSGDSVRVNLKDLKARFDKEDHLNFIFGNISKFRVSYLDAESRLKVAKAAESHNPHTQPPTNLLQGLFGAQNDTEDILREAFRDTFGMDVRLDYSGMKQLMLRVADEFVEIPPDPRDAYPVFSKYAKLDDQGDGFRSFVGVVLSLLLSEGRVILLDEPEAFLHPAQSRQLGMWIAAHAASVPGQIVLATHNASFLSGILASGHNVDIFRMNRFDDTTEYVRIPPEATASLVSSPLLSSQRVLEAIFFRGVIVCEADADRAIYQTVAANHLASQEAMFVHAHNKQSVPQVVSLLRAAHIPVAAIVDLDAFNSAADLKRLTEALAEKEIVESIAAQREQLVEQLGTPPDEGILASVRDGVAEFLAQLGRGEHTLSGARGALNRLRKLASDWYDVKTKGVAGFPPEAAAVANQLLADCRALGLFLVPCGELESWIDLGTTRKNAWVVRALETLHAGECPAPLKAFVESVLALLRKGNSEQSHAETTSETAPSAASEASDA